jgi:hypothetical protein
VFGFRPESCSPSSRNRVRHQPGTLFGFTPESRSPCPGIPTRRKAPKSGGNNGWMKGFWEKPAPKLRKAIEISNASS